MKSLLNTWWTSFKGAGRFESEQKYADECAHRLRLSDDEFLNMYYPLSSMRRDVPLRIRKVFNEQFGFDKIVPTDRPCEILQDIDLQVILDEVADEFGVSLAVVELPDNSGSVDSIVRLVNMKLV
jgi:hypothetical protein